MTDEQQTARPLSARPGVELNQGAGAPRGVECTGTAGTVKEDRMVWMCPIKGCGWRNIGHPLFCTGCIIELGGMTT